VISGEINQFGNKFPAKTTALMLGVNGDIADIGTVPAVDQRPTRGDQFSRLVDKALEQAVREYDLQIGRVLVSKRSGQIQVGEFLPVYVLR